MYQSLANAVQIEAAKANTRLEQAKAELTKALATPVDVPVGRMEDLCKAQAALQLWTKLYLVAAKYQGDAAEQSRMLVRRVRALRDELVEEYEVQSTSPWVNAEARTARKVKVEVYAVLREFVED